MKKVWALDYSVRRETGSKGFFFSCDEEGRKEGELFWQEAV